MGIPSRCIKTAYNPEQTEIERAQVYLYNAAGLLGPATADCAVDLHRGSRHAHSSRPLVSFRVRARLSGGLCVSSRTSERQSIHHHSVDWNFPDYSGQERRPQWLRYPNQGTNTSTDTMWVYFDATNSANCSAATKAGSFTLIPGQSMNCNVGTIVLNDEVCITGTSGDAFAANFQ